MKLHYLIIAAATLLAVPACEQKKTTTDTVKDKVDDALNRRPGEKVRDAAEDARDAAKKAGKDIKEAGKDATEAGKEAVKETKEAAKDTTK